MLETSKLVADAADRTTELYDWGELKWLCNAALSPGAALTFGHCRIHPGKRNPVHYHPNCEEVLYMLAGVGRHGLDDREIELRAGMTIRIPVGVRHYLINTGSEPIECLIAFSSGSRETTFLE